MSFIALMQSFSIFVREHILIFLAIEILILYILIWKPKFIIILLGFIVLLIAVFYLRN
jgi:1,4-dihydroxy-2-naphthoate octaprenyltransferase